MLAENHISKIALPQLSNETLAFIKENTKLIHVKSNTVLLSSGKICDKAYFVIQGGFVCRYINEDFEIYKTINFYLEDIHPFMACVDSFFTQIPTQCELRAISESLVLEIKKEDLDIILKRDDNLNKFYQSIVITALTEENDLKLKIIAYTSEQLYQYFMENFPMVIQRVPSKYIAELMGISAEWLSKLKKQAKKR